MNLARPASVTGWWIVWPTGCPNCGRLTEPGCHRKVETMGGDVWTLCVCGHSWKVAAAIHQNARKP
jgi:hypothetical protein